jgi:hypothetical protein
MFPDKRLIFNETEAFALIAWKSDSSSPRNLLKERSREVQARRCIPNGIVPERELCAKDRTCNEGEIFETSSRVEGKEPERPLPERCSVCNFGN